jgi:hypothetical protein
MLIPDLRSDCVNRSIDRSGSCKGEQPMDLAVGLTSVGREAYPPLEP